MLNTSFSPWPDYTAEEADAVSRVLLSNQVNYWTGSEGREFEKEFAAWVDCDYAVAVANGTVALEAALIALGVGEGDEVIVTSRTFIASVSAIVLCGARPVFADVELDSQNISSRTIRQHITPQTRAVICVHLAGWPCDMDGIMSLARQYNLSVIEDCAQAHGAMYKNRPVGSIGDIGVWSFCQDKIITTGGEGGMVTTNNYSYWSTVWAYKDHGKSYDAVYKSASASGFRWVHESFGTNWRMTEMQSVIGRIQLSRIAEWTASRRAHAKSIHDACRKFPVFLRVPEVPDDIEHAWYKCYVFVRDDELPAGWGRDRILTEINNLGVPCYTGSCSEVYLEKAFKDTTYRPKIRLENARKLGETSLMFLVHPTLTEREISITCDVICEVMSRVSV